MTYYVRSEDGVDYSIGAWDQGVWTPGTREDAIREARLLRAEPDPEPTAYAWGRA